MSLLCWLCQRLFVKHGVLINIKCKVCMLPQSIPLRVDHVSAWQMQIVLSMYDDPPAESYDKQVYHLYDKNEH